MRDFQRRLLERVSELSPLYLVGGVNRDELLQESTKDLDVVTELSLDKLENALQAWGYRPLRIGAKHPTISVFEKGERTDFNTFSGDLFEDALRRDFTLNAIYRDVRTGDWIDPLGGISHLNQRLLKACSAPERCFGEDPVRILRLVRFAVKYRLNIDEATFTVAKERVASLSGTAQERIAEELGRILVLDHPVEAILLLEKLGYWQAFLPELARLKGLAQNSYHVMDAWDHTLQVVKNSPPRLLLRLAALFHDLGKWETASRECYAWGVLTEVSGGIGLGDFRLMGKNLRKYLGQGVEVHGARLDHYPEKIQVKGIKQISSGKTGFQWVEQGKRHFLNHERESGVLARRIFSRYRFSMALGHQDEGGEKELLWLIENHMVANRSFQQELRGQWDEGKSRRKIRKFAWDVGWNGRAYSMKRIEDLLDLWQADFLGGKNKLAGEEEVFRLIQAEIRSQAALLSVEYTQIDWSDFDRFAAKQHLTGKTYGEFRETIRRETLLGDGKGINFSEARLEQEYSTFLKKSKKWK